jgi:hypothetical protein
VNGNILRPLLGKLHECWPRSRSYAIIITMKYDFVI